MSSCCFLFATEPGGGPSGRGALSCEAAACVSEDACRRVRMGFVEKSMLELQSLR